MHFICLLFALSTLLGVAIKAQQVFPTQRNTVRLTSTAHPISGNQEFCLALSETIIELVKKKEVLLGVYFEGEDIKSCTWS